MPTDQFVARMSEQVSADSNTFSVESVRTKIISFHEEANFSNLDIMTWCRLVIYYLNSQNVNLDWQPYVKYVQI